MLLLSGPGSMGESNWGYQVCMAYGICLQFYCKSLALTLDSSLEAFLHGVSAGNALPLGGLTADFYKGNKGAARQSLCWGICLYLPPFPVLQLFLWLPLLFQEKLRLRSQSDRTVHRTLTLHLADLD